MRRRRHRNTKLTWTGDNKVRFILYLFKLCFSFTREKTSGWFVKCLSQSSDLISTGQIKISCTIIITIILYFDSQQQPKKEPPVGKVTEVQTSEDDIQELVWGCFTVLDVRMFPRCALQLWLLLFDFVQQSADQTKLSLLWFRHMMLETVWVWNIHQNMK